MMTRLRVETSDDSIEEPAQDHPRTEAGVKKACRGDIPVVVPSNSVYKIIISDLWDFARSNFGPQKIHVKRRVSRFSKNMKKFTSG